MRYGYFLIGLRGQALAAAVDCVDLLWAVEHLASYSVLRKSIATRPLPFQPAR